MVTVNIYKYGVLFDTHKVANSYFENYLYLVQHLYDNQLKYRIEYIYNNN